MEEEIFNFEKLEVYQKALQFTDTVYRITISFPKDERFCLTDQFRRAAVSIGLNIAEGYGLSKLQFKNFLQIAKGSIRESIAIITIASSRKYIENDVREGLRSQCSEIARMLSGLIRSLDR